MIVPAYKTYIYLNGIIFFMSLVFLVPEEGIRKVRKGRSAAFRSGNRRAISQRGISAPSQKTV